MASLGPRPFIVVPSRFTHSRVCGAWPCQLQELRDVTIKDAIAQLGETKHQEEGGKKEESELPATSVERRPTGSDLRFVLLEEPQALRKMMKTVRVLLTFKVERALPAPLVCPGVDTGPIVRAHPDSGFPSRSNLLSRDVTGGVGKKFRPAVHLRTQIGV